MCPATASVWFSRVVSQQHWYHARSAMVKRRTKSIRCPSTCQQVLGETVEDHTCNVRDLVGIGRRTNTFATHCAKWQASAAGRTRVQQCASVGRHRPRDEHACNTERKVARIVRQTNTCATVGVSWHASAAGRTMCVRWQASAAGQTRATKCTGQAGIGSDSNDKPLQRAILRFRRWVFLRALRWYKSVISAKG